jgi:sarcosine oxidase subunit alpha
VFPGNDVPGVMLASAVQRYAHGFGVAAGQRAVLFGNNDGLADYEAQFAAAGIEVAAVLDSRRGEGVLGVSGRKRVRAVRTNQGDIACDLLAVSGGWSPVVHLFSQSGGSIAFCEKRQMFVPDRSVQAVRCVGGAAGDFDLNTRPWHSETEGKAFVDLANDVTAADVRLAARENYASVEHLKRYTTLGMGPDQGKTSNVNGLMLMGDATGRAPGQVGTTRFRPPYTPVSFGAIAGARTGELVRPRKFLPAHRWHEGRGAVFEDYGWQRPEAYPQPGESIETAAQREAKAVRAGIGLFDGSPLGKISSMSARSRPSSLAASAMGLCSTRMALSSTMALRSVSPRTVSSCTRPVRGRNESRPCSTSGYSASFPIGRSACWIAPCSGAP